MSKFSVSLTQTRIIVTIYLICSKHSHPGEVFIACELAGACQLTMVG